MISLSIPSTAVDSQPGTPDPEGEWRLTSLDPSDPVACMTAEIMSLIREASGHGIDLSKADIPDIGPVHLRPDASYALVLSHVAAFSSRVPGIIASIRHVLGSAGVSVARIE